MEISALILAVFASSGLWTFATTVYNNRKQKQAPMDAAVLALLHDRINDISQESIIRGCISFDDFENLTSIYIPYRDMGGNGTGKSLYETVERLPRVDNYNNINS